MKIILSNQSEFPIYRQIFDQIVEQIQSGDIPEGTTLPSIRGLAKELGMGYKGAAAVYYRAVQKIRQEVKGEGYIVSRQGKGSIVLGKNNSVVKSQYRRRMEESLELLIENARYLEMSEEEIVKCVEERLRR